jgi:cytochrome c553
LRRVPWRRRQFFDSGQPQARAAVPALPRQAAGGLHRAARRAEAGARERHHERHRFHAFGADRADVAAWFYSQAAKPGTARSKDLLELGQKIWRAGLPEKALPACSGCHNPAGLGVPIQYPRLAGQHGEYVEATLKAFRDGVRRNNVPMQQIAGKMTDTEMRAVADFIQGLRASNANP